MECGPVGDNDFGYSYQAIRVVQHVPRLEDPACPSPVV